MGTIKGLLYFLLACVMGTIGISIMAAGALIGVPLMVGLGIFGIILLYKEAKEVDSLDS